MHSLRWRIATWYAALLIVVIFALGIAVTLRFEYILRAQAQDHNAAIISDMERSTAPAPFSFSEGEALLTLGNPDNLERWASPSSYIEVDDLRGYPLAKSFNMGPIPTFGPPGVSLQQPVTARDVDIAGRPYLVTAKLLVSGNTGLIVQIGQPLDQLNRALSQTQLSIAIILAIAIVAVALLSYLLAAEVTTPINRLAQAMREIGSEGLSRRLRWRGRQDEVGALAHAFDDLLARLEEAFARERQFISDASHELKTPLTSINANAQLLARWGDRDDRIRRESLETIIAESTSLAGIVNGMLTLAKADTGEAVPKEPLALSEIAQEAVAAAQSRALEKGLSLEIELPESSPVVQGNAALLRQLFTNLIENAIKFTERGGVTVRIREYGGETISEVQDTGPGIDPAELPLIFERFYRTDKSRTRDVPGTGLGLAIVRSIARVHGGAIEAERPAAGGTVFRLRMPPA